MAPQSQDKTISFLKGIFAGGLPWISACIGLVIYIVTDHNNLTNAAQRIEATAARVDKVESSVGDMRDRVIRIEEEQKHQSAMLEQIINRKP
jgi:hypothetical protein